MLDLEQTIAASYMGATDYSQTVSSLPFHAQRASKEQMLYGVTEGAGRRRPAVSTPKPVTALDRMPRVNIPRAGYFFNAVTDLTVSFVFPSSLDCLPS